MKDHPARLLALDAQVTRDAALADPAGFVAGLDRPIVLDEIQRAPDLLLAIKEAVDRDTRPGQFLLTGSANVLSNRWVKDALTGRMEIITLWPLAQSEIHGSRSNLIDSLLAGYPPQIDEAPVARTAASARSAATHWCHSRECHERLPPSPALSRSMAG